MLLLGSPVNLVLCELLPETLEFSVVLLNIVGIINYYDVLLVTLASLYSPIERSGDEVRIVDDNELVMHVKLRLWISSASDTLLRKPDDITTLISHALVVRDYSHLNSSFMRIVYCISKLVICQIEDTDFQRLLRFGQVLYQSVNVLFIGEEEGIKVSWLSGQEVFLC